MHFFRADARVTWTHGILHQTTSIARAHYARSGLRSVLVEDNRYSLKKKSKFLLSVELTFCVLLLSIFGFTLIIILVCSKLASEVQTLLVAIINTRG